MKAFHADVPNLGTTSVQPLRTEDATKLVTALGKLELDIGNGKVMKEIPAAVCAHDKIEWLRISNGSIRKIPDAIGNMKSLRELEMQSTSVTRFPASMATLPNLKSVKMKWSMRVAKDSITSLRGVKFDR